MATDSNTTPNTTQDQPAKNLHDSTQASDEEFKAMGRGLSLQVGDSASRVARTSQIRSRKSKKPPTLFIKVDPGDVQATVQRLTGLSSDPSSDAAPHVSSASIRQREESEFTGPSAGASTAGPEVIRQDQGFDQVKQIKEEEKEDKGFVFLPFPSRHSGFQGFLSGAAAPQVPSESLSQREDLDVARSQPAGRAAGTSFAQVILKRDQILYQGAQLSNLEEKKLWIKPNSCAGGMGMLDTDVANTLSEIEIPVVQPMFRFSHRPAAPHVPSAPLSQGVKKARKLEFLGQSAVASTAGRVVIRQDQGFDQGTQTPDLEDKKKWSDPRDFFGRMLTPPSPPWLALSRGTESATNNSLDLEEAETVDHLLELPVGAENQRSNILEVNEEAKPVDSVQGPQLLQLLEQPGGVDDVGLERCAGGMEMDMDMDTDRAVTSEISSISSRTQLRHDIHFMGFTSFEVQFNPHQILFLYDVVVSTKTVEMLFFHTEGMASLFGIGLSFSKVLVGMDFQITIEEMSEQSWRNLWEDSYQGSFKPMIFEDSMKNVSSTSPSSTFDLSSNEALSKFGVAVEGRNHYKPKISRLVNKDESNIFDFGTGWVRWVDRVLKEQKELDEKKCGGERVGKHYRDHTKKAKYIMGKRKSHTNDEGSVSKMDIDGLREDLTQSTYQESGSVVDFKEEVNNNNVKKLIVVVQMNHQHSKLFEENWVGTSTGMEELHRLFVDPSRIARDDALSNSFIKPEMTIEFLYSGHLDNNMGSKLVDVKLKVDYQINSSVRDPLKFGWYQKDLQLSFHCEDPLATRIDAHKIISPTEPSDVESTTNTTKSQSSSKGSNLNINGKVGPQAIGQVEARKGTKEELVDGSSMIDQVVQKSKVLCLVEAPSFAITSVCVGHKMAYEAIFWHHMESHKLWDSSERLRAKASAGMFSSISIEVQGSWELIGNDIKTHVFQAEKELQQHRQTNRHVLESNHETLWQTYCRKFMFNHSFSQFHALERFVPYSWILVDGHEVCPIDPLLN